MILAVSWNLAWVCGQAAGSSSSRGGRGLARDHAQRAQLREGVEDRGRAAHETVLHNQGLQLRTACKDKYGTVQNKIKKLFFYNLLVTETDRCEYAVLRNHFISLRFRIRILKIKCEKLKNILVRIRIHGSAPLRYGSGSCSFHQWLSMSTYRKFFACCSLHQSSKKVIKRNYPDPDPGGSKTYGCHWSGSGSTKLDQGTTADVSA